MQSAISAAGLILSLVGAPYGPPAAAPNSGSTDPGALGRVVILPILDHREAPHRAPDQHEAGGLTAVGGPSQEAALAAVEAEFRMRGIEYVRRAELAAALGALKLDAGREEERTSARLTALGDALKARTVVTGVIEQASASWRRRGVFGEGKAEARVRFRVYDVRTGRDVEGIELTGAAAPHAKTPPTRSNSRVQKLCVQAVREATVAALTAFLKPYPSLYPEDPGEAFVVYATRPERVSRVKPAAPTAALPKTPVLFKLIGGQQIEGQIEKFEYGIYTVLTPTGRVFIAKEHILTMTPKL